MSMDRGYSAVAECQAVISGRMAALAKLAGTSASVICPLQDADYEGHSFAMLRRIASALRQRIEIRFVPVNPKLQPA
jgi:hypothetical protein